MCQTEATIRFQIKDFTEFSIGREPRLSEPIYFRGLPWKILAIPPSCNFGNNQRFIGFYLQCDSISDSWSCSTVADLKIVSQRTGIRYVRPIFHIFNRQQFFCGYPQFISFDQLLHPGNGYLQDDAILLEVAVNPKSVKEAKEIQTDIKLQGLFCAQKQQQIQGNESKETQTDITLECKLFQVILRNNDLLAQTINDHKARIADIAELTRGRYKTDINTAQSIRHSGNHVETQTSKLPHKEIAAEFTSDRNMFSLLMNVDSKFVIQLTQDL